MSLGTNYGLRQFFTGYELHAGNTKLRVICAHPLDQLVCFSHILPIILKKRRRVESLELNGTISPAKRPLTKIPYKEIAAATHFTFSTNHTTYNIIKQYGKAASTPQPN